MLQFQLTLGQNPKLVAQIEIEVPHIVIINIAGGSGNSMFSRLCGSEKSCSGGTNEIIIDQKAVIYRAKTNLSSEKHPAWKFEFSFNLEDI